VTLSEDAKDLRYTVQLNADEPIAETVAAKVKDATSPAAPFGSESTIPTMKNGNRQKLAAAYH
jgi:hypothetical protein